MSNQHTLREGWLTQAVGQLSPLFERVGHPIPKNLRVACSWPGGGSPLKRIGECWSEAKSAGGYHELFISPVLAEPARVLDVLAHELCHACVGVSHGHKAPFRKLAKAIGLEGKMTATVAGDKFKAYLKTEGVLDALGPYPHDVMDPSKAKRAQKKQGTRLLKAECPLCGYTVRVTKKWVDEKGAPRCGDEGHGALEIEGMGEGEERCLGQPGQRHGADWQHHKRRLAS